MKPLHPGGGIVFVERLHRRSLSLVIRYPARVLIALFGLTVILAWPLPLLKTETSIYDLVIEDLPETSRYRKFIETFGSDELIRVVIKTDNVFSHESFSRIVQLAHALSEIPGIRRVIGLPEILEQMDIGRKWSLEQFKAYVAPVEVFKRYLISDDSRSTALTLVLSRNADQKRLIRAVEEMIDKESGTFGVYQIGIPVVSLALSEYTKSDVLRIPPITLVIIGILLVLLFRQFCCVVIPILTVAMAQLWTFGIMAWLQISLSMLTMIVPVLLIAVGTAYCLHLCSEFRTLLIDGESPLDAISISFKKLTLPTVLAVATTLIGLSSLYLNRIQAIREFATISCFGMISILFLLFSFFPAMLALTSTWVGRPEKRNRFFFQWMLGKIVQINLKYRRACFAATLLIVIFCLAGIFRIRVETNPVEYFKKDNPIHVQFHDIYQDLSGSFPINVVMTAQSEEYFSTPAHVQELANAQKILETLPGIDKAVSFADYVKVVNYAMNRFDPKFYTLPGEDFELRMIINNYQLLLGEDILKGFMNPDFSSANILLLTHVSSSLDFLETRKKILSVLHGQFDDLVEWEVTGLGMVISESSHQLIIGQIKSLSLTFLVIFIIMSGLFLSSKVGLIALLPNFFPIILNFGLMGWLGVNLSVATSLIASIAIGLAVDDTIHYMVRYNREFKRDLDKDRSLRDTIFTVGRPIIFTTVTIICGFSILLLSHFKPTALFGVMMVVTLSTALIGDLLLLPSLMLHVELITAWDLLKMIPSVGGVPPGIAHELNQPLNTIKIGSEFLKMMLDQGQKIDDDHLKCVVHEISDQVDRASAIVHRLQKLGSPPGYETRWMDLNLSIHRAVEILKSQLLLDNIELHLELSEKLPEIFAQENRLSQVIYNLLTNAWDAINEKTRSNPSNPERIITIRTFHENQGVIAEISDTGIGIADHLMDRIFEPFFTTRQEGKGKGLGLAICQEIIRDCGGRIRVKSQYGQGTTFRISLPVSADGASVFLEK
jgi:hypothetical protein